MLSDTFTAVIYLSSANEGHCRLTNCVPLCVHVCVYVYMGVVALVRDVGPPAAV